MVKINLGSGPVSAKGWINYDWGLLPFLGKYNLTGILVNFGILPKNYNWVWPKIKLVDLNSSWPCPDNSVDFVFMSQVLEHFDPAKGEKIIKQINRILKPGGKLRLSVPSAKKICQEYLTNSKNTDLNEIVWGYDKRKYENILGKIMKLFIRGHQWIYDEDSLAILLNDNGFDKVKFFNRGQGSFPDLKELEIKEHEKFSLYVEARKSER